MSGGYTRQEVIENIRNTKSKAELNDLAYHSKGQIHKYAEREARMELKRRMKPKKPQQQQQPPMLFGFGNQQRRNMFPFGRL